LEEKPDHCVDFPVPVDHGIRFLHAVCSLSHGANGRYRFALSFCVAGCEPVISSWLSKTTPQEHRGVIFGWFAAARATGWMFAPLASGTVALMLGIRFVFFIGAMLLLGVAVAIAIANRLRRNSSQFDS